MNEPPDFLIFLGMDWERFVHRHLLSALADRAQQSKFLCIDRPVCPLSTPVRSPTKFANWALGRGNARRERANLFVCRPFVAMHDHVAARVPWLAAVNRAVLKIQITRWLAAAGVDTSRLVCWISDPFQADCLGLMGERLSVYDSYDEFAAWGQVPLFRTTSEVRRRELQVLSKVDVAFVVSELQRTCKTPLHRRAHVLPWACDVDHFGAGQSPDSSEPGELSRLTRPVVGLLGNLSSRIDFNLLHEVMSHNPGWTFLAVGRVRPTLKKIKAFNEFHALANTHLLGFVAYSELPRYLQVFDVCVIPYDSQHPWNVYCSPAKLYEYLATGKPIVSTDIPAVHEFEGLVRIARDAGEFEGEIREALRTSDPVGAAHRLQAAHANSWEQRSEDVLRIIDAALAERLR
jgi:glycosyltransferase involved in cell wall biosynthesis